MTIYSLFILSKAGGLIYQRTFSSQQGSQIKENQFLTLASTFHGLHAIARQLSPVKGEDSGIEIFESDTYKIQCYGSPTGTKFFCLADLQHNGLEAFLRQVYDLYCDFVMKNPFCELEQPIHCELFTTGLDKAVNDYK